MRKTVWRNGLVIGIIALFSSITFAPSVGTLYSSALFDMANEVKGIEEDEYIVSLAGDNASTEYWALLVAVGIYKENPWMNRLSMLVEVENLYNILLLSTHWEKNHIKIITGKNATIQNIFDGFRWLDRMEDESDICLVYLTTHGFPIFLDLPPFDEEDRMDEALATYNGFLSFENPWSWGPLANPFGIIIDDQLNYYLNRLESKGLCIIVDSCYSGGFNDNWSYAPQVKMSDSALGIARDTPPRNRVTMTSVPEENVSFGSYFTQFLIEGMEGYSDSNEDGMCSAEEIFWYAETMMRIKRGETGMQPQIFDDYMGELLLTEAKLP